MFRDIDSHISKISGQADYMKQLESITGNIMSIDYEFYKRRIETVDKCDGNIKILFRRIVENITAENHSANITAERSSTEVINESTVIINSIPEQFSNIYKSFIIESEKISVKKTFITRTKPGKKPREIVNDNHRPTDYVSSEWFSDIKKIELEIDKFKRDMIGKIDEDISFELQQHKSYQKILHEQAQNPLLLKLKTIFGVQISSEEISNNFLFMYKCAKKIMDIFLLPAYDVKNTIKNHWSELKKVFKEDTFNKQHFLGPDDIILMLEQFVVAKYRATITNNNSHYVKLFFNLMGNENIGALDGPRFLEMMDNIDLEQLSKGDKIYTFASSAKETLKQIINKEKVNVDEIVKQFNQLFENIEKPEEKTNDEIAEQIDIL
jgi:hypothetical protein